MELIGPGEEPAEGDDPLAALFTEGPSEPPSDPALARLFPDAYGGPDEVPDDATHAAAAEFRRYTENDLRTRKREDALAVVRALDALGPAGGRDGSGGTDGPRETDGTEGVGGTDATGGAAGPEGAADGAVLRLRPDESRQWLGALNDLRLAIGTRLEVTDEDESGELLRLPDSDPRKPMVMAYLWLGGLQESLIETLTA
ncbi:DUF2017 domain-containing protein [Streptomyces sp. Ac-502]|uniref:DUF2017 domain-containing protein n=1 Tax=Streptomyces sp. Ac-502 TaxID=3342801 RepID=UPI003862BCA5